MDRPAAETVWRAIDLYLERAYDGPPPPGVRARLEQLRAQAPVEIYRSTAFERGTEPGGDRLGLRLGNRHYPHMKLVIERVRGGGDYVFCADTHDHHAMPDPGTLDYLPFLEMMAENRSIAEQIEGAWGREGIPTFRQLLQADVAMRRAVAAMAEVEARE